MGNARVCILLAGGIEAEKTDLGVLVTVPLQNSCAKGLRGLEFQEGRGWDQNAAALVLVMCVCILLSCFLMPYNFSARQVNLG